MAFVTFGSDYIINTGDIVYVAPVNDSDTLKAKIIFRGADGKLWVKVPMTCQEVLAVLQDEAFPLGF